MNEITFSVERAVIEAALTKALLERPPYGHDEPPLLQAARRVVSDNLGAIRDLVAGQVRILLEDKDVREALRERLLKALSQAIDEKAGSIVRSLSKADIVGLLTPSLTNAEILRKRDGGTP